MAEMTDIEPLPARVERIEQKVERIEHKLDALSNSVDQRFAEVNERFDAVDKRLKEVDRRFDEVSEHVVEQREYTEFAFDRLRGEMVAGFTRLERVIAANTRGLGRLERKLDPFIVTYEAPPRSRRGRRPPKKQSRR
jgi:hypothetical protein